MKFYTDPNEIAERLQREKNRSYSEGRASVISAVFVMIMALGIVVVTVIFGSKPENVYYADDIRTQRQSSE